MPSGHLLQNPQTMTPQALKQLTSSQPATEKALAAKSNKPQIPYIPATNAPLNAVATTTTITAHVSPDAGLATLQAFIAGTKQSLIIGMYDFTSGAILKTFEGVLTGNKTLQMVLDDPAPNPKRDQTDDQTVQALNSASDTSPTSRALLSGRTLTRR